jgi:flagellar biosynthesis regulator FlbT
VKTVVWILILAALGYLVYTLTLKPLAGEMGDVRTLEKEFNLDTDRYISSLRQAGEPGMPILSDPEFAERKVKEVRQRVAELLKSLREPKAQARARALQAKIDNFCKINQID